MRDETEEGLACPFCGTFLLKPLRKMQRNPFVNAREAL